MSTHTSSVPPKYHGFTASQCTSGKTGYLNRSDAKRVAKRYAREGNKGLGVYLCDQPGCVFYHVGHHRGYWRVSG